MTTRPLAICAIAIMFLSSCTEAFKHKQEVADKYIDDMEAGNVVCGVLSETNNGESRSMTTFTFSDCSSNIEDMDRQWAASKVANDMLGELTDKDLEGETHLKIIAETKDGISFTYLFELAHLKRTEEYMKIADATVAACIADDQEAIDKLKDDGLMPDDAMHEIYDVTHYNDSVYEGQKLTTETLGYFFANAEDNAELEMFSVDYDVIGDAAHTTYTINVDRNTNKVVAIWLKTRPN